MNSIVIQEPTTQEETKIKSKVDDALVELKWLNAEMAEEQKEIDKLKMETKELHLESYFLMERTQAILAALEAG